MRRVDIVGSEDHQQADGQEKELRDQHEQVEGLERVLFIFHSISIAKEALDFKGL